MNIAALNFPSLNAFKMSVLALMALLVTACGGDDAQDFIDPNSVVEVIVSPSPASVDIGGTVQLSGEAVFGDRQREAVLDGVWSSADEGLATVDNSGLVTATASDFSSVVISLSYRDITGSVTVDIGACGESDPSAESLELTPSGTAETTSGELLDFTATGKYCTGGTVSIDRTDAVTWASTDDAVLEIGSDGRAVARSAGAATISAELDGITESVNVTVAAASVQVVQVTPTSAEVVEGFTFQLKARAIRSDNTQEDVTNQAEWESADDAIATVDAAGLVTGVSGNSGTQSVVITATFDDNGNDVAGNRSIDVISASLQSIEILAEGAEPGAPLAKGLSRQYSAYGTFESADETTYGQDISDRVTWVSDCTDSLTIGSSDGLANAVEGSVDAACADGNVTITVTGNGTTVTQTQTLIVTDVVLVDGTLEITPDTAAIAKGETQQFNARGDFSDGTTDVNLTSNVTWSVSGTDADGNAVASIGVDSGLANGLNQGGATVSALYTGGTQSGSSEPAATANLQVGGRVLVSIALASDDEDDSVPQGVTVSYTATGTYSDNSESDITNDVTWTSNDTGVADIDSATGVATTGAVGSATITATEKKSNPITADIDLAVTDAELVSVAVTPGSASVSRGDTVQLTATATYTDGSTQDVTTSDAVWSSDDDATASVGDAPSTKGRVTGNAETASGSVVTITASVTIGSITEEGTAEITVTAPRVVSLLVEFADGADGTIAVNETVSLSVTAFFADGTDRDVTNDAATEYNSVNTAVATVNGGGVITGVSQGSTRVDVDYSSGGESTAKFVDITVTP